MNTTDYTLKSPYLNEENENEHFESDNLTKCLDYYSETKDREPLEMAISNAETEIEKQISQIQYLIDVNRQCGNDFNANKLIAIRNKLNNLLK